MSTFNVTRWGENAQNATPAFDDLWLPLFGGEVLARFDENLLILNLVEQVSMTVGTTFRYPRLWKTTAERHAAGAELLGLDIDKGEIEISLDERPITSHISHDDIDAMMAHFDLRSKIATEQGRSIAREVDKNVARLLINTSRTPMPANGPFLGGGINSNGLAIVDAALADDGIPSSTASRNAAGALIRALDRVTLRFEDNDVNAPHDRRCCVIRPSLWHALRVFGVPVTATEMFGDNASAGPFFQIPGIPGPGAGMLPARDMPLQYGGFLIYQSPNMGLENVTTGPLRYQGDFSNTVGVIFQKMAMAYLRMIDAKTEMGRVIQNQADLVVVKHLGGGGALRPELAVELRRA